MKHINKLSAVAAVALAAMSLISCGSSSGSSADSNFFGNVPGIFANMIEKKDALKEKYMTCSSEDEARKIQAEAASAEKEFSAKLEEAAKALDSRTIEIQSTPEITVNSPVALTFDGFSSKLDLTPRFKLTGDVVAAQNYQSKDCKGLSSAGGDLTKYTGLSEHVYLIGLDESGNQLFASKVAYFPIGLISDTELGVKAGTPLVFETFTISKKNVEGCIKAKSLRLSFQSDK